MEMWVWLAIAVALALLLVVLVVAFVRRSRRRAHLQETFGSEYDRAVADNGKRQHAEQELLERKRRHEEFELRPLTAAGRARLEEEWRTLQILFIDDPEGATRAADGLVARVMEERGYPHSDDRDQRAADLSVEHPQAVSAYRRGWSLLDGVHGSADGTESLRQAMRSFRTTFEELLGERDQPAAQVASPLARTRDAQNP